MAVVLILLAGALGLGIGHALWASSSGSSAAPPATTLPVGSGNGNGSSGLGSGSGNSGTSGGTGSSGNSGASGGFGQSPFASGGSSGSATPGAGAPSNVSGIAAKVAPGLVDLNSQLNYQQAEGAGTGIVLTSTGEVLTNNHVIANSTKLTATDIGNGRTYNTTVLGYDASHDIALIQLQGASGLQTASIGDSTKAAVGDPVVAIGNAGGTGGTPSSAGGSITALDQSIAASDDLDGSSEQLTNLIQINADVEPGDSGGSLVNANGQVIGIDTAASQGFDFQSGQNQGFAIPINQALDTVRQIRKGNGSATLHIGPTAFLGVGTTSVQTGQGGFAGQGGFGTTATGADISEVFGGTAAEQAGLSQGDVITSVDGQTVDSPTTLGHLMTTHHPGDKIQLGWTDATGAPHVATIDLGTGPPA